MHINVQKKLFEYDTDKECVICINSILKFEDSQILECGHIFHNYCIEKWLYQSKSCPTCKNDVVNKEEIEDYIRFMNENLYDICVWNYEDECQEDLLLYSVKNGLIYLVDKILYNYSENPCYCEHFIDIVVNCIEYTILDNDNIMLRLLLNFYETIPCNDEIDINTEIISIAINRKYIKIIENLMRSDTFKHFDNNNIIDMILLNDINLIEIYIENIFELDFEFSDDIYIILIENIFENTNKEIIDKIMENGYLNYKEKDNYSFWKCILKNSTLKNENFIKIIDYFSIDTIFKLIN